MACNALAAGVYWSLPVLPPQPGSMAIAQCSPLLASGAGGGAETWTVSGALGVLRPVPPPVFPGGQAIW